MAVVRPTYRDVLDPNNATHRQAIIKRIQERLKGKLLTYTASPYHPLGIIMIQDVPLVEELLRSVADSKHGYLMINSQGGDANAAEKLLMMCRERFPEGFEVIVPNYAKSAATMLALGSDKIWMGYMAELGPIDPQIAVAGGPMAELVPARAFLNGLETIRKKIKEGDPPQMYLSMLANVRPELLAVCESAIADAQKFAEKWLKKYMLKADPAQAEKVAKLLSSGETYLSHGKVINHDEAKNVLKLDVEKIDPASELWADIWELHWRSILFFERNPPMAAKLYESESQSLIMNINIQVALQAPQAPPAPQPTPQPAPEPAPPTTQRPNN